MQLFVRNAAVLLRTLFVAALLCPAVGHAGPQPALRLFTGIFNTAAFLDNERNEDYAWEAGIELHMTPVTRWQLVPLIGGAANEENAFWVYTGLGWHYALGERWRTGVSLSTVYYDKGDSKDLGNSLEFRTSFELARILSGGESLGVKFYHLSNASISQTNPGSNSLVFFYSTPLDFSE